MAAGETDERTETEEMFFFDEDGSFGRIQTDADSQ